MKERKVKKGRRQESIYSAVPRKLLTWYFLSLWNQKGSTRMD